MLITGLHQHWYLRILHTFLLRFKHAINSPAFVQAQPVDPFLNLSVTKYV